MKYHCTDLAVPEGFKLEWLQDFEASLRNHIRYVQKACDRLGVPDSQMVRHDQSKWSPEEFPHYARHFHGDKGDLASFQRAWLHHQNHNPHHWEYWISRSHWLNDALPMPENYVREMVADWMGASMAYTGSWSIDEWCTENIPKMRMHAETRVLVGNVLGELGYHVSHDPFANRFVVRPPGFVAPKRRAIIP